MADPTPKKSPKEAVVLPETPAPPPMSAQESEVRMLAANQAQAFKAAKTGAPTAVLPFGQRIDATRHVQTRYRNGRMAFLADPESVLTEEWKREHRGWKYEWPVKGKLDTNAYLNAQRYTAVPYSAVDKTNHNAMLLESPEGLATWMQHVLVAVSPQVWYEEKQAPVDEYVGRMSMSRRVVEQELNESFAKHGYRAEVESGTDQRQER